MWRATNERHHYRRWRWRAVSCARVTESRHRRSRLREGSKTFGPALAARLPNPHQPERRTGASTMLAAVVVGEAAGERLHAECGISGVDRADEHRRRRRGGTDERLVTCADCPHRAPTNAVGRIG